MSYDNKEVEHSGAPKKADVLIQSTQTIVNKQEELVGQTKLAVSRIDEAIGLCHKNSEEASRILEHSTKMFEKLQAENSALKQELLYLAKQSENIYAGLAEKLNEMEQEAQLKNRDGESEDNLKQLADRLAGISIQISELSARVDTLTSQNSKDSLNDKFAILYDKMDAVAVESARPIGGMSGSEGKSILDRLDQIADSIRKTENQHSMLADRFEILSMRVEQYGFGSAKPQPVYSQPASYPVTVQASEIDYDKLASKVAELLSVKDAVSPDYIASKVAEQIVLPESNGAGIDTKKLATEVASLINVSPTTEVVAPLAIDEQAIADRIAEKLNITVDAVPAEINEDSLAEKIAEKLNVTADVAPAEIDEDTLAEKIAEKLGVVEEGEHVPEAVEFDDEALVEKIVSRISEVVANNGNNIDQEDLADSIALKVGSLRPDDFEIIVDDTGCASISQDIAQKLDYNFISTLVADKLREILDINAANAPDYEDMAERISEKITVAGINEDAIAEKAAAVLSNYLPEFDTEEIADKVTGAVIDVVSAIPHPTFDSEAICNEITERLAERQEERDYDIVIDDDGISRITAIVTEEVEKNTGERLVKLEENLDKITEMLAPEEVEETEEQVDEDIASRFDKLEEGINKITEMLAPEEVEEQEYEEVEEQIVSDDIVSRFDKVDGDIAKIYDIVSNLAVSDGSEEYTEVEEVYDEDYSGISGIVASEIERSVASRLDSVEEKLNSITDMLSGEALEEPEEAEEYTEEEISEEEYQTVSDAIADLSTRFEAVEQKIDSISELLTVEDTEEGEEEYSEEEYTEEYSDDEYAKLSEIVSSRFDGVEQKIDILTDLVNNAVPVEEGDGNYEGDDFIAEIVSTEIEKGVASRLDGIEEKIAKISAIVGGLTVAGVASGTASDIGLYEQFDKVSEDIAKLVEYIEGEVPVIANERVDKIAADVERVSQLVEGELSIETAARLDRLQEEVEKLSKKVEGTGYGDSERLERVEGGVDEIKGMLISGAVVSSTEEESAVAQVAEEEEPEELVTVSEIVKPIQIEDGEDDGDFILSALDMDSFSDDERMPGELGDLDGVDFENMMKYNRSFIARIIQSDDDCKQYYGAVKQALLSYKKVNSNVAWSNERFNKGRETIARMKIRGKTLVIYLALDPNEYKTSVYHHADVSNNNSVPGTPMMIKVKSPLGVRKAIRLIDEMLAKRNGEKREVPERDYAAMYPYETIEELIEDGLVKDVRKK